MATVIIRLDPDKVNSKHEATKMMAWLDRRTPLWSAKNNGVRWGERWDFEIEDSRLAVLFKLTWG